MRLVKGQNDTGCEDAVMVLLLIIGTLRGDSCREVEVCIV